MDDLIKTYTADIDLLLTEVCMAGAMYGLDEAVGTIVAHLRDLPRTEGAALLALALAKITVRDFAQAIALTGQVLANPQLAALHAEAVAFQRFAQQLAAGQPVQPVLATSSPV